MRKMRKLPYGISNYEELITDGYYYVVSSGAIVPEESLIKTDE